MEPDGSLRVVEYWADDKSGFNAVVKKLGPSLHPQGPVPIYKAPIPLIGGHGLGPISVGSVAKYGGLAGAPLLTGPVGLGHGYGHGPAVSTASLIKSAPIVTPIIKPVSPIAPAYSLPLIKSPILPVIKSPIVGPYGYPDVIGGGLGWKGPIGPALAPIPVISNYGLGSLKGPIGLPLGAIGLGGLKGNIGLPLGPIGLEGWKGPIGLPLGPIGPVGHGAPWDGSLLDGWKH